MTDYAAKAITDLLYGELPKAVRAKPDSDPLTIVRSQPAKPKTRVCVTCGERYCRPGDVRCRDFGEK